MKELEQYKIPIIFGAIGLVLAFTICQHWLFQNTTDHCAHRIRLCP